MTATDAPAATAAAEPAAHPHAPPQMAPRWRRAVMGVLWVVFALWVAGLVAMYFETVYPHRHPKGGTPPAAVGPSLPQG